MTLQHMVVPIEWKADDSGDGNTLVGYASTFGNVDLGGDVVVKGAFRKSIETINAKGGGIPLLADHVASTASVLGTIFAAKEDDKGLQIKARISQAPSAQDTAVKLREGHLSKMSIGYEPMDYAFEDKDGQRVRLLKEVKLWETSVVVFPMNPKADISYVKSVLAEVWAEVPADERKSLVDSLDAADREQRLLESEDADKAAGDLDSDSVTVTTDLGTRDASPGDEAQVAPETPVSQKADDPDAGGEPAAEPGEGESGYDRYTSRAILHGRPLVDVDPVKRAELEQRLRLAESQLPAGDDD